MIQLEGEARSKGLKKYLRRWHDKRSKYKNALTWSPEAGRVGYKGQFAFEVAAVVMAYDVDAIAPGRGGALIGKEAVARAIESTRDFVNSTYQPAAKVAVKGGSLKDAWDAVRDVCDPKFKDYAIYEHCLPFNVSRAYDEARGIAHPRIWTDKRDLEMWEELQG